MPINLNIWKFIVSLVLAICVLSITACSTVTDWVEEHPTEANLARAALLTGLNLAVDNNPELTVHKAALRGAINLALSEAATAEEAAAILDQQTIAVLDDADVRAALLAAWQAQLDKSSTSADGLPASGPQQDFARKLARALDSGPVALMPGTAREPAPVLLAERWF